MTTFKTIVIRVEPAGDLSLREHLAEGTWNGRGFDVAREVASIDLILSLNASGVPERTRWRLCLAEALPRVLSALAPAVEVPTQWKVGDHGWVLEEPAPAYRPRLHQGPYEVEVTKVGRKYLTVQIPPAHQHRYGDQFSLTTLRRKEGDFANRAFLFRTLEEAQEQVARRVIWKQLRDVFQRYSFRDEPPRAVALDDLRHALEVISVEDPRDDD